MSKFIEFYSALNLSGKIIFWSFKALELFVLIMAIYNLIAFISCCIASRKIKKSFGTLYFHGNSFGIHDKELQEEYLKMRRACRHSCGGPEFITNYTFDKEANTGSVKLVPNFKRCFCGGHADYHENLRSEGDDAYLYGYAECSVCGFRTKEKSYGNIEARVADEWNKKVSYIERRLSKSVEREDEI